MNADDRRAAAALDDLGLRTDAVRWDDPRVDWLGYGAVVLRSTWDYHRRVAEFHAWIDRMEAIGARLWNPPRVLRWNTDKRYLARLAHPTLAPPPTEILERGAAVDLAALLEASGWDEAVMKPAISADGFSTERTSRERAASDQAVLDAMLGRGDVVVQQLVPEIRTNGEISMMFFSGVFSHAVSKRPQAGEFRVQERLGGRDRADRSAARAGRARPHAPGRSRAGLPLRPRGRGGHRGRGFVLMEVELLEPSLYFEHDPPSARAFALAIQRIA